MDYVYVEYPKCLYNGVGETVMVENSSEEENAAGMGWMTAEQYHKPNADTSESGAPDVKGPLEFLVEETGSNSEPEEVPETDSHLG